MNHNPTNSNPKFSTSCRGPLEKNIQDYDKPVFESQNEVYTCSK